MNTDIVELSKLLTLPFQPEAVWWHVSGEEKSDWMGPSDWEIMAVLQFSQKDLEAIINNSKLNESLSPDKIVAASPAMSELLKGHGPVGDQLYNADLFAKSPLIYGIMVKIKGTCKLFVNFKTH